MSQSDDSPKFPPDDLKVDFGEVVKVVSDPKRIAEFHRQEDERRGREMKERADRARADAIASFVVYPGPEITHSWVCPSCTAVITDRERHLDFHGGLAAAAADAHEAAWRGRPIG